MTDTYFGDFPPEEFEARLARAQQAMAKARLDALLLTTEAEVRYFTGFRSLFWQSPTRSWFVVVPQSGKPIAIIPSIGADLMGRTWIDDVRTWPSPRGQNEGVSLLVEALGDFDRIGMPMGEESSLRMPMEDFRVVRRDIKGKFKDCTQLIKGLRMVKSEAEIAILRDICQIGSSAFARIGELAGAGDPLMDVFRRFKIALLEAGAEDVPYLVGAAGPGGYGDVISPPGPTPLAEGDVLMLDTGATLCGYFCDFDRNFAIGRADAAAMAAHQRLWDVVQVGLTAARPGVRVSQVFEEMDDGLGGTSTVGRLGHGLGMQLTEWPSFAMHDDTVLEAGMVITLEPSMPLEDGRMMVAEENALITETGAELITVPAPRDLPVI